MRRRLTALTLLTSLVQPATAEGLYGGALMGVRSGMSVAFHDWELCRMIQVIDVETPIVSVYWSDGGDLCTLACEDSFYLLRHNADAVAAYFDAGG